MQEILNNPDQFALITLMVNGVVQLIKSKIKFDFDVRYINGFVCLGVAVVFTLLNGLDTSEMAANTIGMATILYASTTGLYRLNKGPKKVE